MFLRSRKILLCCIAAVMAVALIQPATAGAVRIPDRLSWVRGAEDPSGVMTAISEHGAKLPPEFAERLKHVFEDGTIRVMVALADRDAAIEGFVRANTSWLRWYGDGPRFLGRVDQDQLASLLRASVVEFVEPDHRISNFMSTSTLDVHARSLTNDGTGAWSFDPSAGAFGALRSDVPGLSVDQATGKGVAVQITDSGIDKTHRDFGGWSCVAGPYKPCESRIVKAISVDQMIDTGADPSDSLPTTELASGHGTHVAGTVAGNSYYTRNGSKDAVTYKPDGHNFGIAPQANLVSVKNGDTLWAGLSSFALQWTLDHADEYNIRVSSNSWGCVGGCSFNGNSVDGQLFRDLYNAGVVVTFAAGNDGGGADGSELSGYSQSPYVLGIANYDDTNYRLNSTSSRGSSSAPLPSAATWTPESEPVNGYRRPDLAAPGTSIWSARTLTGGAASVVPRQSTSDVAGGKGCCIREYAQMSGTSMSTPHVSGAAAVLFSSCESATPLDVMRALMVSADSDEVRSTDGSRVAAPYEVGYGSLEIRAALDWLLNQAVCGGTGGGEPSPSPTSSSSPSPEPTETTPSGASTRYYFHSGSGLGQTDWVLGETTFDTTAPTFTGRSQSYDLPAIQNGASGQGPYDPYWEGTIAGSFEAIKVNFWQRAPVGDLVGQVDYSITLTVGEGTGAVRYKLPTMSKTVDPTVGNATTEISHLFTTMLDASGNQIPLAIDPAGKPVTITIAGTFVVNEAGAWIDYDAVGFPSGFTVFSDAAEPTESPTPTSTPTSDPTEDPNPSERGTYPLAPSDSLFADQWGMDIINAPDAWQEDQATGYGVKIAIVDSGVDLGHPDLACGKLQVLPGSDVSDGDDSPQDEDGHGTHVAGIAGACTDNSLGVVGVAPDATIMPVRATGGEADLDTGMAEGIRFATDNGAHVINLSIGPVVGESALGPELYPKTEEALDHARKAGVVIAAASGNWSFPTCEFPSMSRNVICVSATDRNDLKAWYSDLPNNVDRYDSEGPGLEPSVVAPGGQGTFCEESIVSTYLRGEDSVCYSDGYDSLDGTSMASPHVAGLAALVYDRLGGERSLANADTVVQAIIDTAADLGTPGYDPIYGYGRIDALAAVRSVEPVVVEPPAPAVTSTEFTDGSATGGQYTDEVTVAARVTDVATGAGIENADVVFELAGEGDSDTWTVKTDPDGVASRSFNLDLLPDSYALTARYAGEGDVYSASADLTGFVVDKEGSKTVLSITGTTSKRAFSATTTEQDAAGGLAGVVVEFFRDGVSIGSATTNADGVASLKSPPRFVKRAVYEAVFSGNGYYTGSSDRYQEK